MSQRFYHTPQEALAFGDEYNIMLANAVNVFEDANGVDSEPVFADEHNDMLANAVDAFEDASDVSQCNKKFSKKKTF